MLACIIITLAIEIWEKLECCFHNIDFDADF